MTNNLARAEEKKVLPKSTPCGHRADVMVPTEPLSDEVKRRLALLQSLDTHRGKAGYGAEQARVAQELEMSLRSLYRLQRQYREVGIAGIKRQGRSDKEHFRVSEYWQSYIVKAYREGNKGQRQTSRAQVAKLVGSHAAEIGESDYPSRRSVYRVLTAEIEQAEQKQKRRSIGWQGETLKLRTKEGIELDVEYSNQV